MDESPPTGRAGTTDLGTILAGATVGVVVLMGVVASVRGWVPTGDVAFISLRTRHLFSTDPILLNNASSAGPSAGSQYNHPGAFPLTLLAPVTLIGGPGVLALATALVNAGWIGCTSWMVRRIAGWRVQVGASVLIAVMVMSMDITFLVDPWNPLYGVWPVAALVVAAWGVRRGHTRMLAVVVLAASVAFQTHLSLMVLSVSVAAWATMGAFGDWYTARHERDRQRRVARAIGLATVVGAVANAQLLADEFVGSGNLSKIIEGTGFKEATVSLRQIAALLVSKLVIPPWWFRSSWNRPVLNSELPSTVATVVGLVLVVGLTAAGVRLAWRKRPEVTSLFGVLAVAAIPAVAVSTRFPLRIGIPLPYYYWVWPLAAIWWAAMFAAVEPWTLFRTERRVAHLRLDRALPWIAAVVTVVSLVAAVRPWNARLSSNPERAQDVSERFSAAAVRATEGKGPVLVEQSIQQAALWVIPALIDQLDAAGIAVRATDAVLIQQTDEAYRSDGSETLRLVLRGGLQIDDVPVGGTELARYEALSDSQRAELDRLVAEYSDRIESPGAVRLTSIGAAETDAEQLRHLTTGELPAEELVRSVPFRLALERGALAVDGVPADDLRRLTALGADDGGYSMALYLVPIS